MTALYHLYLITAKKEKGNKLNPSFILFKHYEGNVYIGYESSANPDIDENW